MALGFLLLETMYLLNVSLFLLSIFLSIYVKIPYITTKIKFFILNAWSLGGQAEDTNKTMMPKKKHKGFRRFHLSKSKKTGGFLRFETSFGLGSP